MQGIDNEVIKAGSEHNPLSWVQLLTYLKLLNMKLGYLLNFGLPRMKDGVKRGINTLTPET